MALKPVERRLVHDDVFDQLLDEVVGGELSAGDALPSERRLAEVLGVSRPAIRECAGEDCTRLFVDRSRAGNRTWCGMDECGASGDTWSTSS